MSLPSPGLELRGLLIHHSRRIDREIGRWMRIKLSSDLDIILENTFISILVQWRCRRSAFMERALAPPGTREIWYRLYQSLPCKHHGLAGHRDLVALSSNVTILIPAIPPLRRRLQSVMIDLSHLPP
eukprot:g10068.t1